jgi:hypothetical protein
MTIVMAGRQDGAGGPHSAHSAHSAHVHLAVFTRVPVLGQVQRRLTRDPRRTTRPAVTPGEAALIATLADMDDGAAYAHWRSTRRGPMR